ncbi:MAG: hypothetical protein ACLGHL_06735 [Actinomycetota bacterium]
MARTVRMGILLAVLATEIAILLLLIAQQDPDERAEGRDSVVTRAGDCRRALAGRRKVMRVAQDGRFTVAVPRGWSSRDLDGAVVLSVGRGGARLSAGEVSSGNIDSAVEDVRRALYRIYREVRFRGWRRLTVGGCEARLLVGSAVNEHGAGLNLRVLVVTDRSTNYAVAGFIHREARSRWSRDLIMAVRSVMLLN